MSAFLGPLQLQVMPANRWMTLAPFTYDSDVYGRSITVPAEFITDLASTPRLIPIAYAIAGGRARGPATLHDYLYQHPDWEDRALADRIFAEAMRVHQPELGFDAESAVMATLMWGGVRAGGWWPWRRHGKRQGELNPEWTRDGWPGS